MARFRLTRVLLVAAIVLIAVGVWATSRIQASADHGSMQAITAGQEMLIAMLDQETGLRGYLTTRDIDFLEPYRTGREDFERALLDARAEAGSDAAESLVSDQVMSARRWQGLAAAEIERTARGERYSIDRARQRKAVMDAFRRANAEFVRRKERDRDRDRSVAEATAVAVVVGFGIFFGLIVWLAIERPARRDYRRRHRLAELGDALQVARTEHEAFNVLKRHIERWLGGARAAVLMRNASANKLTAVTALEVPGLDERLEGAAPEQCLSVRLAKPHARAPDTTMLLSCELCGSLEACTTCVPTIVGGEVVGAVLVESRAPLAEDETEDLQISVAQAGPAIANLRNLAIAEQRAATDGLTGLPNQRSARDTLGRMVAQASRTKSQLAVILFDLDHFKRVNDIHGHAKGDEVLAAVGATVAAVVRESDFVARYGGEEFIALLPATDEQGAVIVAEKLRVAIAGLEVPDLDRRLSASFGIAVLPDNAVTGEQLVRAADRALYAAKNAGRNRVEVVRPPGTSGEGRLEPTESR